MVSAKGVVKCKILAQGQYITFGLVSFLAKTRNFVWSASDFLQYLDKHHIKLGTTLMVKERELYDNTLLLEMDSKLITVSNKIATNLYVQ